MYTKNCSPTNGASCCLLHDILYKPFKPSLSMLLLTAYPETIRSPYVNLDKHLFCSLVVDRLLFLPVLVFLGSLFFSSLRLSFVVDVVVVVVVFRRALLIHETPKRNTEKAKRGLWVCPLGLALVCP